MGNLFVPQTESIHHLSKKWPNARAPHYFESGSSFITSAATKDWRPDDVDEHRFPSSLWPMGHRVAGESSIFALTYFSYRGYHSLSLERSKTRRALNESPSRSVSRAADHWLTVWKKSILTKTEMCAGLSTSLLPGLRDYSRRPSFITTMIHGTQEAVVQNWSSGNRVIIKDAISR